MNRFLNYFKKEAKDILETSLLNKMFYGDVLKKYKSDNASESIILDILEDEEIFEKLEQLESISETLKRVERLNSKGKLEQIQDSYFYLVKSFYNVGDNKALQITTSEFLYYLEKIKSTAKRNYLEKRFSEMFTSLYLNYLDSSVKKENILNTLLEFLSEVKSIDINSIYTILSIEYQSEEKNNSFYSIINLLSEKLKDVKLEILDKVQLENIMIMATEENMIKQADKIGEKLSEEYGYIPNVQFVKVRKILADYLENKIEKEEAEKRIEHILDYIKDYSSNLQDEENKYIYFLSKLETLKTFEETDRLQSMIEEIEKYTGSENCELCMIILLECYALTNDVEKFKKLYKKIKKSEKLSKHKEIMDFIDFLNDEIDI